MLKKLVFTLLIFLLQHSVIAQTNSYTGANNGDWNTATNWSLGLVPTSNQDVVIPSGKTVTISANSFAKTVSISGTLKMDNAITLTVSGNFTVNTGGSYLMPTGSGLATLIVYGNYINNGTTDFWKSTVVIVGDLLSPSTSELQNNGNVIVGGNIIGDFDITGGSGSGQIYAVNPNATVTITPTSIDNNVIPGTSIPATESASLITLVNQAIYGGSCSFTINDIASVSACSGNNAVFTVTTAATSPTYQWQVNVNGSGWVDLTNGVTYSGVNTSILTINSVTTAMNNYKYRANITSSGCAKSGNYGFLIVNDKPTAPTVGTITVPTCTLPSGSVVLSGLPASGTWTLTRSGTSSGTTTGTGTSTIVSGLASGTYAFTIYNGICTSVASGSVVIPIISISTKTWNGTAWTPSVPTSDDNIVFAGDYNSNANISGCSCQINSGNIIIGAGGILTLTNALSASGGSITFQNNSSLVQINNVANTGTIIYQRTADNIKGSDFVYWSSPVSNQSLNSIYSSPVQGPKYQWNTTINNGNGASGNISQGSWEAASGTMVPAKGYIVRGSSDYAMAASNINTVFTGVPNNGDISIPVYRGGYTGVNYIGANGATITKFSDNNNLLGNPYPSAISALQFLYDNSGVLEGSLSLWTHNSSPVSGSSPFYGSFSYNYSTSDYRVINGTGSTIPPPPGTSETIKTGQAFFVKMLDGTAGNGTVVFNNNMRNTNYSNSSFFKMTATKNETLSFENIERHRIWLDIVASNSSSGRTLLGYVSGATLEVDHFFDALKVPSASLDIYSLIGEETYQIQGRPLPFNDNDIVPIGFKVATSGSYHIAINTLDGLFETQNIYLEDLNLNIIHDLKQAPYLFTSEGGTFNNRFVLRYTNGLLGTNDFELEGMNVLITDTNQEIKINSFGQAIDKVFVYDLLGREIYQKSGVNSSEFEIQDRISNKQQILLVEVILNDGKIVTNKIFY